MEEQWYKEALKEGLTEHKTKDGCFIIYKGFKLNKVEEKYTVQDVRYRDLYSSVKEEDREVFKKEGFIKGSCKISLKTNLKRIALLEKEIGRMLKELEGLEFFSSNSVKCSKKSESTSKRIEDIKELIKFYRVKINQVKINK